jgi:isoleucyl-tRNA synthetase
MLGLIAPVLTYTADEILDFAPKIIKKDKDSIFDLVYQPLPKITGGFEDSVMMSAREAFYEEVDRLKKEKLIKATLELEIAGKKEHFTISDSKDLEDWFVVSAVHPSSTGDKIGSFEVQGDKFTIHKATAHKCPRCWRFVSAKEDKLCDRCGKAING